MNLDKILERYISLFSYDKYNSIFDSHDKSQIILGKSIHPWLEDVGLWAGGAGGPQGGLAAPHRESRRLEFCLLLPLVASFTRSAFY